MSKYKNIFANILMKKNSKNQIKQSVELKIVQKGNKLHAYRPKRNNSIHLIARLIKTTPLYKMVYYPEPDIHRGNKVKLSLNRFA